MGGGLRRWWAWRVGTPSRRIATGGSRGVYMASLRRRILWSVLAVLALAIVALGYTLSHESACEPAAALAPGTATMNAVVRRCYGPPEVLALEDVEKPVPADDQVPVKVRAA